MRLTEPVHHVDRYPNVVRAGHPRRRTHRKIRAAIEAMERRILRSTITVNTFADQIDPTGSATISLRDAIAMAAKRPGADTIDVPAGRYKLALGELQISDTSGLTIDTTGGAATIDAQKQSGVMVIDLGTVLIRGVTFTNGVSNFGGGIENHFTHLTLVNCTLTHNTSTFASGGGIDSEGTLTIDQCTIADNSSVDIFGNGGIGGGISNTGQLTLKHSTISGNSSTGTAGNTSSGTGGGVDNFGSALIVDCTICGNSSGNGGGINDFQGTLTLLDSTVVGNSASGFGGGVESGGRFTVGNSIIAQNKLTGDAVSHDVDGPAISRGHNLIGQIDQSVGWTNSDQVGIASAPLDPQLSPLGNFGGPTRTMVPMAGSPALTAGSVALVPQNVTTDQRGLLRVAQGHVDIGAVQAQLPARVAVTAAGNQSFAAGQSASVKLGSFTAPTDAAPFLVSIHWGDRSPDTSYTLAAAGALAPQLHMFGTRGRLTVSVAITDRFGDLSNNATFIAAVSAAPPSSIVVNTTQDEVDPVGSSTVSLRDAIRLADSSFGPVSIGFAVSVFSTPQTITLGGTELELGGNTFGRITITGPAAGLTLSGDGKSRVLLIDAGVNASLKNLTIENGNNQKGLGYGGAIGNVGDFSITNCVITANKARFGGAIENAGTLLIANSQMSSNSASESGGAICNRGDLTILQSTITGNTTSGSGGGIYNSDVAVVSNCTLSDDSAPYGYRYVGGGIENKGTITVTNSTFVGNTCDTGSAFNNDGAAEIFDCTFDANSTAAIANDKGATLKLANSIVAASRGPDVAGAITSLGHNLIGNADQSSGWLKNDRKGSGAHPMDPHLSPLDFFGGPAQTQVPLPGSAAIAAGSATLIPAGVMTDQRGFARISGGLVDVGAVELQRLSVVSVTPPPLQHVVAGDNNTVHLGSFTDSGGKGRFHVIVHWGDGSPNSYFTVGSSGSLGLLKHTFIKTGNLSGTIWVRDAAGDLSNPTPFALISATHPPITLAVNTVADRVDPLGSATVSLRDALTQADAGFGPFSITFDPAVFATPQSIMLRNIGLNVSHNTYGAITVMAPRAALIISGRDVPSFFVNGAVFKVEKGITVNLNGLIVVGAHESGIVNNGTMTISRCTISHSGTLSYGGGINNSGVMTVIASAIENNATGDEFPGGGGGIYNSGTMTIVGAIIRGNRAMSGRHDRDGGGGIDNAGAMTVSDSLITSNQTSDAGFGGGGGISNTDTATLTINHCTISANSDTYAAGGGVHNFGSLTISGSSVSGNSGIGILSFGPSFTLTDTLVWNNSDAGLDVFAATVVNCTIADNLGSGIHVEAGGALALFDSTITGNSAPIAGGIYCLAATPYQPAGKVTLANTIVAANTESRAGAGDISGAAHSLGYNLIGQTDGSSGWIASDLTGTTAKPLDPKLSDLGNHGGPTQTQLPLPGSPALGAGSVALIPKGITTDQRGKPRVVNGKVDIGAVELQANEGL